MKYTFFLFFLINVLVIKSQSFGVVFTSGIWTTKNIERELDKEIRKGIKRCKKYKKLKLFYFIQ